MPYKTADSEKHNDSFGSDKYHSRDIGIKELKVEHFMTKNPIVARSIVNFPGGVDIMTTNNISNLVVVENRKPIGVLTEREILHFLTNYKTIPVDRLLKDVALQPFCKANSNTTLLDAAKKIITKKCRILVFSGGNGIGIRSGVSEDLDRNQGSNEEIIGIITASDMVRAFAQQTDKNPPLKSVMSKRIAFINSNDPIYDAVNIMHTRNVGSVIVVENEKSDSSTPPPRRRLFGIFTERDLMSRVLSHDVPIDEPVRKYCSTDLLTAQMGIGAIEASKVMYLRKIKRLPLTTTVAVTRVFEAEKTNTLPETVGIDDKYDLGGIVTARDLVEVFQRNN
jgi:CBS domain-containing protein